MQTHFSPGQLLVTILLVMGATAIVLAAISFPASANADQNNSSRIDPLGNLDPGYNYREFPYSDFSLNGFEFKYTVGQCVNPQADMVYLLPCGSRLSVRYPHYGWNNFPIMVSKNLVRVVDGYAKAELSLAIVNGEIETVTLTAFIAENNTRTVFIGAKGSDGVNEPVVVEPVVVRSIITIAVVALLIAALILVMRRPASKTARTKEQIGSSKHHP